MHLAFNDHRVNDGAKVIHGGKFVHLHHARRWVYIHLADIGACGEGEVGGVVKRGLVQARLKLVQRVIVWYVCSERHLAKGHFFVGTLDGELTIGKLHVRVARLHQMGGDFLGLGLDFVQCFHDG